MEINCANTPFVLIALNKNLLSNSPKNVSINHVNFVTKDLMEKQISIGILNQFMREINHMRGTLEM